MASYAQDTREDDWLHNLARIKIIIDDNELRRQGQTSENKTETFTAKINLILNLVEKRNNEMN